MPRSDGRKRRQSDGRRGSRSERASRGSTRRGAGFPITDVRGAEFRWPCSRGAGRVFVLQRAFRIDGPFRGGEAGSERGVVWRGGAGAEEPFTGGERIADFHREISKTDQAGARRGGAGGVAGQRVSLTERVAGDGPHAEAFGGIGEAAVGRQIERQRRRSPVRRRAAPGAARGRAARPRPSA